MKKGLGIIIPLVIVAAYLSRPVGVPAHEEVTTPPVEPQTSQEEAVEEVSFSISPTKPIQGDPVLVEVHGLRGTSTIRTLKFSGESLPTFVEEGKVRALIGIDLRLIPGSYPLTLTLTDGRVIQENITVGAKEIVSAPLGIPETLGGNTPEAEHQLVNTLVEEGKIINAIKSSDEKFWTRPFGYPLAPPITITDVYGYSRETGGSSIAHKGTDFRAAVGTPVLAVARGRVAYTGFLRNYGNVIAIDHGTKVLSIYMHLSRVDVAVGQVVEKGEQIALSGETGYVLGPHLHLTIRINNISIDPMKFFALLGLDK